MKFAAFTKSFQDRSIPEVCGMFQSIGLDGLDLTVRPGGHIEPDAVRSELPQAVQAAQENGLQVLMLTTSITEPDERAEAILATASEVGIDRIKLGYYSYDGFGDLARQIYDVRRRLERVSELAAKHNVLPCVHIHSGSHIPSHGTMLYELLRDISPERLGAYVDPLHMTLEGGADGWRQGLDLLGPWIALTSIKNFAWEPDQRDATGQLRWRTRTVPIADGIAPLPDYVAALQELGYDGIYSLHSEYKGGRSFEDLDTDACLAQTKRDLAHLRKLFS